MGTVRVGSNGEDSRNNRNPTIFVIDGEVDSRRALNTVLSQTTYDIALMGSASEALQGSEPNRPGCFLIDIDLPEMNGLTLRQQLVEHGCLQPFIAMSAKGCVSSVVAAFHCGALDFFEKPTNPDRLMATIHAAVRADVNRRKTQRKIDSLTDRERQLLPMIADGRLSKEISKRLGISPRTVEVHRRNVMRKMGANCVARLVRILTDHSYNRSVLSGKSIKWHS